jgi:hypothetical protein
VKHAAGAADIPGLGDHGGALDELQEKLTLPPGLLMVMNQKDHTGGKPAISGPVSAADEFDPFLVVNRYATQTLDDEIDDPFLVRQIG